MNTSWRAIAIALIAATAACDKGGPGTGKERGPCYGNRTCDPGLACMSDLCVRPPPADCAKVADKLASYRLGNYAPRDERARVIGELTASCEEARLSEDEGRCLLEAKGRIELARCPRPLLDELAADRDGCKGVGDVFARLFVEEIGGSSASTRDTAERLAPELRDAIAASCVDDVWPDEARRCVLAAASFRSLNDCEDAFPADVRDRIEDRLEPVIERLMRAVRDAEPPPPPPPPPVTPPPATVDAGTPPPQTQPQTQPTSAGAFEQACGGYIVAIEAYAACPSVPADARDATRKAVEQMRASFQQGQDLPPEAIKALADACAQGEKAIRDARAQAGCP